MNVGEIINSITTAPLPFVVDAYDGSTTGHGDITVHVSRDALAYITTAPGDLGLARAYITGELTVDGPGTHPAHPYDLFDALQRAYGLIRRPSARQLPELVAALKEHGAFHRLPIPPQEQLPGWRKALHGLGNRHSKARDASAIHHHYDVSNKLYELFLGPSMTYTCACYPGQDATLEQAQENKYRLVFDKLNLAPGQTLLDVGCGWGGMVRYAAARGVKALGVTLSAEQARWAQAEIERQGLADLAEVRYQDYRDLPEGTTFDAISAIGILEHIGPHNYDSFFATLYRHLADGGLLLNHCITRPHNRPTKTGQFIGRYIFPDGELQGSGTITAAMENAGFDVLHTEDLRPHYARTLNAWCRNLQENWEAACETVHPSTARLFGLYMAGSEWGFDHNVVQLHQFLGQKLPADGAWTRPLRPWWDA